MASLQDATALANEYGFMILLKAAEKGMWNRLDELEKIQANQWATDGLKVIHADLVKLIRAARQKGWVTAASND